MTATHPVGQMTTCWFSIVYNSHMYGGKSHTKYQMIFNPFCCNTYLNVLLSFYKKERRKKRERKKKKEGKKNLAILEQPIVTEFYKHLNFVLKILKTIATCKSFCTPRAH